MKKIIFTPNAPAPIGPYSQAVQANGMLYISGQIAIEPTSGDLVLSTLEEETEQVMKNLEAILVAAGLGFEHAVKTTILLSDMNHFATVNEIYGKRWPNHPPARETFAVKGLPKGVNVEISMVVVAD